ncbi:MULTISPECIES: cupin domain-containing protein [Streptomyces]|uniref:cupin domain-containing protein n=1 Tax=Streptomyces TaxID=1883 RepID=UPI001D04428E|nr:MULTISPECIES: cupin domain-containing protein [Streptomyces]
MSQSQGLTVTAEEIERRTIRRAELVPDRSAFIDTCLPECAGKENYALIGPGVAENTEQVVPVSDPHGFNLGVAAMPHGITNSLHLHFTAEVFSCFSGEWLFRWGVDGSEGECVIRPGDVVSMPTWMFRGFTNIGADDGWMFSSLGMDETGGIIWAPSVLKAAAEHGNYLSADNRLVRGVPGQRPEGVELTEPMPEAEVRRLRPVTPEEMRQRLATPEDLVWSTTPFLDSELPGGGAELALVIGYGVTEDRNAAPRVHNPHGFSLAWLRAEPGKGVNAHRHDASQVLMVKDGRWRVTLNRENPVSTEIGPFDTLSVPAGAWRTIESVGEETGQLVVMTGGDGRVRLEWDESVREAALAGGVALDANGYLAPASLVGDAHR